MAQNIPVLPVVIDCEPGHRLQTLHSIVLTKQEVLTNDSKLRSLFSESRFRNLVNRFRQAHHATFRCGFQQGDRTLRENSGRENSGDTG